MNTLTKWLLGIGSVIVIIGIVFFAKNGDLLKGDYLRPGKGAGGGNGGVTATGGNPVTQSNAGTVNTGGSNPGNNNKSVTTVATKSKIYLEEKMEQLLEKAKTTTKSTNTKTITTDEEESCPYATWKLIAKLNSNGNLMKGNFETIDMANKQGCEIKIVKNSGDWWKDNFICSKVSTANNVNQEENPENYIRMLYCASNPTIDGNFLKTINNVEFLYIIQNTTPEIAYKRNQYFTSSKLTETGIVSEDALSGVTDFSIYARG